MYTSEVRKFTVACHESIPNKPTELSKDEIDFITKMVNDELKELEEAKDVVEQADALVDAIYYICDMAARKGINLDPLFKIVHTANMEKVVDGKVIRREDGKIMKPVTWKDPEPFLKKEILRQEKEGGFIE